MATTAEYPEFVMDQMPSGIGEFRARKMFGEYMIYCNDKPVLTVCDNAVFVKKLPELSELMPVKYWKSDRCPLDETGRNSVRPCKMPCKTALTICFNIF